MERVAEAMSATRTPTWRERENNKRRERRRRAIAAKIYAGLRTHGNYRLPKHCDNNAVLKALCEEAGWIVEDDGTTYRKGSKPAECINVTGLSASPSPCSSYQLSPCISYNPSPASSTLASPVSSTLIINSKNTSSNRGNSLAPRLNGLSSATSSATTFSKPPNLHDLYVHGGSISAPVTPPLSSPTARSPRIKTDWDNASFRPPWVGSSFVFMPSSMPPSPARQVTPDAAWLAGFRPPSVTVPSSPTCSLVSAHPFAIYKEATGSGMWTTGKSGTCSLVPYVHNHGDVQPSDCGLDEFAFGNSSSGTLKETGTVKPWEGERIHGDCVSDELELTLGNTKTRSVSGLTENYRSTL